MSESNKPSMIEARGLCKYYGSFVAIENVTFSIPKGQVVAFLGPNGAGKSTTMKLLTGYLSASAGEAKIGGFDIAQQRIEAAKLIGYLPENGPLYPEMTPLGLLNYVGEARGLAGAELKQRLEFVADRCSLSSVWNKAIGKLSKGFRQRVGMAQALLHDPQVLILDEPTSGLDPNQVHQVRELITSLSKTKTILLSTHILQEVKAIAPRVILINNGRVVFDGPTEEMQKEGRDMEATFRQLTGVA
ncbi:MAG: ABC transporter ATP-binding protein [Planctomycetales bacterium]